MSKDSVVEILNRLFKFKIHGQGNHTVFVRHSGKRKEFLIKKITNVNNRVVIVLEN
jgi:hypothetical protein